MPHGAHSPAASPRNPGSPAQGRYGNNALPTAISRNRRAREVASRQPTTARARTVDTSPLQDAFSTVGRTTLLTGLAAATLYGYFAYQNSCNPHVQAPDRSACGGYNHKFMTVTGGIEGFIKGAVVGAGIGAGIIVMNVTNAVLRWAGFGRRS